MQHFVNTQCLFWREMRWQMILLTQNALIRVLCVDKEVLIEANISVYSTLVLSILWQSMIIKIVIWECQIVNRNGFWLKKVAHKFIYVTELQRKISQHRIKRYKCKHRLELETDRNPKNSLVCQLSYLIILTDNACSTHPYIFSTMGDAAYSGLLIFIL